jgi:DNA-binding CsgD family transcriptional regulator
MKTCAKCKKRECCSKVCSYIEKYLPAEYSGKNPYHEINLSSEGLEAVSDKFSIAGWSRFEKSTGSMRIDLSLLTSKEKTALIFIASGMPQCEAARRLKISRSSLRSRINKARARLSATQNLYLIEGQNNGVGQNGEGCANG